MNPYIFLFYICVFCTVNNGNLIHEENTTDNMSTAEQVTHRQDNSYKVEVSTETTDEILGDVADHQTSLPMYSQVMKKKPDPSSNTQLRSHDAPARIDADSVRQEVVNKKPQKARASSAAKPETGTSFVISIY